MLTHEEALQLLAARVDGELTPEQEQTLEAWLREHPEGRVLSEAFHAQDVELRGAFEPRRAAAARTAERVIELLPAAPTPVAIVRPSRWRHFWNSVPPIACAAVLAFVFFFWIRIPEAGRQTTPEVVEDKPSGGLLENAELLVPRPKAKQPATAVAAIGQQLKTGPASKQRVALPDGSVLYLDQGTSAQLVSERTIRLERGRIYIEAVPADKEEGRSPFLVWTPKRKLEALGTHFAVAADDATMQLLVTQGKVRVEGAPHDIAAGQVLKANGALNEVAPARRASVDLDWLRDLMVAADSPLLPAGKYDGGALVAVDPYGQEAKLSLTKFHVDVHIEDGFARTTIDQTYFNHENFQMEGTFYFPLPPDASLSRLAMYVADGEFCNLMEGGMAERDYARQTYERIRHARRDPALLEWVDGSLFKMRVFPLEARQEKRIILSYSQKLPVQYGRTTYRFPAGHSLSVVNQWSFEARGKDMANTSAASPSHITMKIEKDGNDLVFRDKAGNVKADRDVVIEFTEKPFSGEPQASSPQARWSSAKHDGSRYLMLRFRPELQGAPKRERRDWVFLFEASGARDPLVARAQVEVIRALLNNAEHDDTFSILAVGTHVRKFRDAALPATDANIREALDFLDHTHLIGALNLDQGLTEAATLLAGGSNPHLVHVGGGIASLGEQRTDRLVLRLPAGTKYVGVAVGKRFSPTFMKNAAENTGGMFTQINPDEPIAWKGFELAAALNTPRLLNITVKPVGVTEESARMLTFANSLAQGEELTAVAKIEGQMPEAVTIRGVIDNVTFERTIPIRDVASSAGYLPRTWAKLEIDRLLAEDAAKHRQQIIEMSKAMYVMTPFTSLLVLENEAMYKEFKVDRGRKDHWAMYPCPEKVPTVFIPDPNTPARDAIVWKERKPHENVVRTTVITRSEPTYLTKGNEAEALGLDWSRLNDGQRRAAKQIGRMRFRQARWEEQGEVKERYNYLPGDDLHSFGPAVNSPEPLSVLLPEPPRTILAFGRSEATQDAEYASAARMRQLLNHSEDLRQLRDEKDRFWFSNQPSALSYGRLVGALGDGEVVHLKAERSLDEPGDSGPSFWLGYFGGNDGSPYVTGEQFPPLRGRSGATRVRFTRSGGGNVAPPRGMPDVIEEVGRLYTENSPGAPPYYNRPSFTGDDRVFSDLAAYAPGMSSSPADIQAVLEAEAAPRAGARRGSIDPMAKQRIEKARTTAWKSLTLKDDTSSDYLFHFDGTGRFACERRIGLGLIERIVCDGTTLLHLYPELGIGARRTVSRFHRAELATGLPDLIPPADDLNDGCDVRLLSENVVALVPLAGGMDVDRNAPRLRR